MSSQLVTELLERGHISPFAGNVFNVTIFGRDSSTSDDSMQFLRSHLRCSAVTIGSPELKMKERHQLSKQQLIDGVSFNDTVTITWLEDKYLDVWNYHRTWMSYFYDRENDQFISGPLGKKRTATIVLQEIKNIQSTEQKSITSSAGSGVGGQEGTIQHILELTGMMPTKLPELSLSWSKEDSASIEVPLTYRVDSMRYQIVDPRNDADLAALVRGHNKTPKEATVEV